MPPHEPPAYLQYLPLLIVLPILFWRMRKLSKPQPLKWQYLWIRPVIFLAIAAMVLVSTPPVALDWLWIGLAALLGAGAGWQWGRAMHIEMHPENGTLMAKGSQAAMLLLVVLVVFRAGLRGGLQMESAAWHLDMVLITDASIVFSALLFAVRGLEMFLRARRVMAAHDAARPAS